MKVKSSFAILLSAGLAVGLVGCGGDETEATAPEPVSAAPEVAAKPSSKKKSSTKRQTRSAMDRIDAALDAGKYMAAVDIAIKAGKSASENMEHLRYVQDELGGPMANGDKEAHKAYQKLNAAYLMNHQR